MQNALFWNRQDWNNGMLPTSNWQTDNTAEMRKYWGWNEVPVDRDTVDNAMNWDAIMVKLPADICNNNWGQEDSISCLGQTEQWALEGDLDSMVSSGKLLLGSSNMGSRPGSYIVIVREWGDPYDGDNGGVNWNRLFFCEDWSSPGGKYKIVHMKKSDDPNDNGACYLDSGDSPSPTPPSPTPVHPAGLRTIEHQESGKCLGTSTGELTNGQPLMFVVCDGSDQQKWNFKDGVIQSATNNCIDTPGGDPWKSAELEVWDCNGAEGQNFGYDSSMNTIYASASSDASLCLDVRGGGKDDQDTAWLWDCNGENNQKFLWHQNGFSQFI